MSQASNALAKLEVELCGKLADSLGNAVSINIPAHGCCASTVLELAGQQYSGLATHIESGRVKLCVNDAIVTPDAMVSPRDSVALFPPVSGG